MALASTLRFGQFLIKLGNDSTPETFSAPCGATSRGINWQATMAETNVPDCSDPDAATWVQRDVVSLSTDLDFSGVVADEDWNTWYTWFRAAANKSVQLILGSRVYQGSYRLENLKLTGEKGKRVEFTAKLMSDGAVELQ